ncbi:EamA family transporter RarD [Salinibacillus xinjiangensis]|uniref:EamA family transporter RarD n=1 Tax=Salinibacillus xinjiangensis TaxID=1229268 RepID=A0A6G1X5U1_9BACI|nr:EamA family transporter RarD [Salinibacillus xinjiangensis]MRG86307.1 EamA family transporter RarD [Salinibacillus xinjiangensis]
MGDRETKLGIIFAASAYFFWGLLPIYWKLVEAVPAGEILAHRIVWSFVFMLFILFFSKNWKPFIAETKKLIKNKKRLIGITLASIVISINWLTYIWAVNSEHVIETSLGYYINPLISILLGVIVLKEKLSFWQIIAFIVAMLGVLNMTIHFGSVPWVALLLATSFGLYGLLKKLVQIKAMYGLTIETLIVTPIALLFLLNVNIGGEPSGGLTAALILLLIGGGIATAVPLLLFAGGAARIPLSMVGFLQYIAPTIMLILGVFVYHEPFTAVHLTSFILIWTSCTIYSLSRTKFLTKIEPKLFVKKRSA